MWLWILLIGRISGLCECDLTVDQCDCCCDADCTNDELKLFDCSRQRLKDNIHLQSRARNFPCKNQKKVGKLRAPWKITSILLNFIYFEISLENQKVMTRFVDNIVAKDLLYTYETLFYYCSVQNLSYSRNIRHDARNFPS